MELTMMIIMAGATAAELMRLVARMENAQKKSAHEVRTRERRDV